MTLHTSAIVLPNSAEVSLPTDRVHQLMVPALRSVGLLLLDFERQPLTNVLVSLRMNGRDASGRTDTEGKVAFRVPAKEGEAIVLPETDTHGWRGGRSMELADLPGPDTPAGQRVRLDNLGYIAVGHDAPESDQEPSRWAIEEFQCDYELEVTGNCDTDTQAKLVEVHGH